MSRDSDGIDESTLSYTWLRCNATGDDCDTEIGTGSTYTLTDDDVGLRVRVRLAFLDNSGNAELAGLSEAWPPATSDPVQEAQAANATGVPTISGIAIRGGTVVAASDGVADPDGIDESTLSYTWLRCDANGNNCDTEIGTGSTYTLTAAEVGFRIKVRVDFDDDDGGAERRESLAWPTRTESAIAAAAATTNASGKPSISGTARVGRTLTAGTRPCLGRGRDRREHRQLHLAAMRCERRELRHRDRNGLDLYADRRRGGRAGPGKGRFRRQ